MFYVLELLLLKMLILQVLEMTLEANCAKLLIVNILNPNLSPALFLKNTAPLLIILAFICNNYK